MLRLSTLVAAAVLLAACDSDHVSWAFISNPSGTLPAPQGGTVVVINHGSSQATMPNPRSLQFDGEQGGREVHVRLATSADVVAIESASGVEVLCPSLPEGSLEVRGGTLTERTDGAVLWEIAAFESADLHPSARGPGRLSVAARGNVVVLEHAGGAVVFGADAEPRVVPEGWELDASMTSLRVVGPSDARVLADGPPVEPDARVTQHDGTIRILGPNRETLALVPARAVTFGDARDGVFLRAELAASEPRCTLVAATDNRYLLRIDD